MGFGGSKVSQPKVEATPVPTIDPATNQQNAEETDKDSDQEKRDLKKTGKSSLVVQRTGSLNTTGINSGSINKGSGLGA